MGCVFLDLSSLVIDLIPIASGFFN
jgi:hypothetical protein